MANSDHGLHQSIWARVKQAVSPHPAIGVVFVEGEKIISLIADFMANLGVELRFMDQS
jgi:hypothetical protein